MTKNKAVSKAEVVVKKKYKKRKSKAAPTAKLSVVATRLSDAEDTLKFAIFDGLVDQWHKKNEPNFAQIVRDRIFEKLFQPQYQWAIKEHLATLKF